MSNLGGGSGVFNFMAGPGFKKARGIANTNYLQGIDAINTNYDAAKGYQQPYYDYGTQALKDFQNWQQNPNGVTNDPSYQWRLDQGLNAVNNSYAAKGGALSGNAMRGVNDYAQGAASQEYTNQFNRWLASIGIGQGAAANLSNISVGKGNALNAAYTGMGNNWFDQTATADSHIQSGETNLNNLVQSWMPAQFGGGKPGNNTNPGSSSSGLDSSYQGTANNFGSGYMNGGGGYASQAWK